MSTPLLFPSAVGPHTSEYTHLPFIGPGIIEQKSIDPTARSGPWFTNLAYWAESLYVGYAR